jgi:hypothetical protein
VNAPRTAPAPEVVPDMIAHASDPPAALLKAWDSGKIIHREVAIDSLPRLFSNDQPLPPDLESTLLAATLDPDLDGREIALGILQERQHPARFALAAEQLKDPKGILYRALVLALRIVISFERGAVVHGLKGLVLSVYRMPPRIPGVLLGEFREPSFRDAFGGLSNELTFHSLSPK